MMLPMNAGLRVTRNTAAAGEFSNRPSFSCSRPSPAHARRNNVVARGSSESCAATSSPERPPSASASKIRSRFAVSSVWLSQYAVLSRTIAEGSGIVAAGRSEGVALIGLPSRCALRCSRSDGTSRSRRLGHGAIDVAFELHVRAAVAHERFRDRQAVTSADLLIARAERLEIAANARVVVGALPAADGPYQRIDRDDPAPAEVFGALERDAGGFLPLEPVLGLELDAGDHRRVDVAAAEVANGGLERLDPAAVADVAVLAGTHLREQRLRPDLEIEADVLHQPLGVELRDEVVGDRAGAERDGNP